MISIELTTGQKVQIGFIVVVLVFAGFMVWRSTQPTRDTAVSAWQEDRQVGVNPILRITTTNPANPKGMKRYYMFACIDGRLRITQYPNDPDARTLLAFEPNAFQTDTASLKFYMDPAAHAKPITDPYRHALTLAAFSAAADKKLGLLEPVGLDADQRKSHDEAYGRMMDGVKLADTKAQTGMFKPDLFKKIIDALEEYKAAPGLAGINEPGYNSKKADAARKVIKLSTDYIAEIDKEKATYVDAYMKAIDLLLTPDQKTRLSESGRDYEARQSGGGGNRAGQRGPSATGRKGAAGTSGARRGTPMTNRGGGG